MLNSKMMYKQLWEHNTQSRYLLFICCFNATAADLSFSLGSAVHKKIKLVSACILESRIIEDEKINQTAKINY